MSLSRVKGTLRLIGNGRTMNKERKCLTFKTNEKSVCVCVCVTCLLISLLFSLSLCLRLSSHQRRCVNEASAQSYERWIDLIESHRLINDEMMTARRIHRHDWQCFCNIFSSFRSPENYSKALEVIFICKDIAVCVNRERRGEETRASRLSLASDMRFSNERQICKVCLSISVRRKINKMTPSRYLSGTEARSMFLSLSLHTHLKCHCHARFTNLPTIEKASEK